VEKEVEFHVSKDSLMYGSSQSSSILPFETHSIHYPHITVGEVKKMKTVTLESLIQTNSIPIEGLTFWNLDIQGVELQVLRGAVGLLKQVDAIYTEVNSQEVYRGAGLIGEIDSLLSEHGLKRVLTYMTGAGWGDALYVRV
jgi:hypothetical protein